MTKLTSRYSVLSPIPIEKKFMLTTHALHFFNPINYEENCEVLGIKPSREAILPLDSMAFLKYLGKTTNLAEPTRYLQLIVALLKQLADGGVLTPTGHSKFGMGPPYYFTKELTHSQRKGWWWLAEALGAEFIYWLYSTHILHITGKNTDGDVVAGTGIAISPEWVLTCGHVLKDMTVDQDQEFFNKPVKVLSEYCSSEADVGLLKVDGQLVVLPGLTFGSATISDTMYSIGFPRVPMSRQVVPVMHRGEVTAPEIISFDGHKLFLYSAVARPGNSGGPLVSENGRVIGIVTKELSEEAKYSGLPFFAGVPSTEIQSAILGLGVPVTLPLEDFS